MAAARSLTPDGGGLNEGTVPSASTCVRDEAAPPALALKPDDPGPPCVPGTFRAASPAPELGASESVSGESARGPMAGSPRLPQPSSHSASVPAGLHSRPGGDWSPGPGSLVRGRDPSLLRGPPQPGVPPDSRPPHAGVGPAWSASPTGLEVACSVGPQVQGFCGTRFQVVLSDGRSAV